MTDYKQLCGKLADELGKYHACVIEDDGYGSHDTEALLRLADKALAEPEPEEPTDEELAKTAMGAVENYRYATELPYFLSEYSSEYEPFMLILHAVLDRWGNSNTNRSNFDD